MKAIDEEFHLDGIEARLDQIRNDAGGDDNYWSARLFDQVALGQGTGADDDQTSGLAGL